MASEYLPLVSQNIQVTPNGDTRFHHGEPLVAYFEVYAASRSEQSSSSVNTDVRIVDAKTGALIEYLTRHGVEMKACAKAMHGTEI